MKHEQDIRVYYADTDSYGVVWHGTYFRWMEQGRVELCDKMGLCFKELMEKGITFPVIDINIRYKSSARLDDMLVIESQIKELKKTSIVFEQTIKNKETGKVNTTATVTAVSVDKDGKMMRRLPEYVVNKLNP